MYYRDSSNYFRGQLPRKLKDTLRLINSDILMLLFLATGQFSEY